MVQARETSPAEIPECQTIVIEATTSEITITGLAGGFFLQNITDISGSLIQASDGSWNNTSLMSFVSGTQYVIYYGNDTISCWRDITTEPMSVKSLQIVDVASYSVSLTWSRPDEYQTSYSYRIQTIVTSSATMINEIIVTSESATIIDLTPGETYTFLVYTRAADNITESDPVSITSCTHPTPPRNVTFGTLQTNDLTLSWLEPVDMTGVTKSYNIGYGISPSTTLSVTSTTTNVALQSLISGTNYSISVVTVGVRGYQSSPVTTSVYTKPMFIQSLQISAVTSDSVSLRWSRPDEYQTSYRYRVQTFNSSAAVINNTIVTSESAIIMNLTAEETYTFLVYTRAADNSTESDPVSSTTSTKLISIKSVQIGAVTPYSVSLMWSQPDVDQWREPDDYPTSYSYRVQTFNSSATMITDAIVTNESTTIINLTPGETYTFLVYTRAADNSTESDPVSNTTCTTLSDQNVTVTTSGSTYYTFQFSFTEFDATNGPITAYAIIVSRSNENGKPSQNDLLKTYSDFKNKTANAYVAKIIVENKSSQRSGRAATQTVTIGDDSTDSPYKNGGLDPGSSYWVGIAGFTLLDRDSNGLITQQSLSSITDYQGPYKTNDTTGSTVVTVGTIVGAVVGSVLGAIVVGLIIFFIVKMRRQSRAMSTARFISHFERQKADSNMGFSEEYEKLSSVGIKQTKLLADKLENREKNRYTNILPYDVSRVVLSSLGDPTEDYINANYIPGYNSPKEYIAAQGPLPRTVNDFWRMIWEKDVLAIIMLTKCVELFKVKCEEYWPQRGVKIYGNLSISMKNENVLQDWTTRDFTLVNMNTKQSKIVRQFHFTAWPDHGVPKATSVLLEFRNLVRKYVTNDDSMRSPMVVHCSAGVGRTGTFIALDRIMKQIEAESQIDVYGVVCDLRMHRALMVQTESQYIFLNQCALDIIKTPRMNDPDLIYQNTSAIYENMKI
ncbi:receptor-type tyrosine-protein phosphatase eta-like [Anomaloglossus baeobatrachus]|uniref:receptor-type tyrosine-protein phosphatase eta-like n=1 Tax=Anomaloglossus baeobatrachus TaxID=238106 RepID=UPI003F4FC688